MLALPRELRARAGAFLSPFALLRLQCVCQAFDDTFVMQLLDTVLRGLVGRGPLPDFIVSILAENADARHVLFIQGKLLDTPASAQQGGMCWARVPSRTRRPTRVFGRHHGTALRQMRTRAILCGLLQFCVPNCTSRIAFMTKTGLRPVDHLQTLKRESHEVFSLNLLVGWGMFDVRIVCNGHGTLAASVDGAPLTAVETESTARCAMSGLRLLQRRDMPRNFRSLRSYNENRLPCVVDPFISYLLAWPTTAPGEFRCPRWLEVAHPDHICTLARGAFHSDALGYRRFQFTVSSTQLSVLAVLVTPVSGAGQHVARVLDDVDVPKTTMLIQDCKFPTLLRAEDLVRPLV